MWHYAKDCRVAIHNIGQGEHNDNEDTTATTAQWYTDYYDNGWYHIDYTQQQPQQQYYTQQQPQQQLALPPIPPTAGNNGSMPIHVIAMISNGNSKSNNQMTTTDTTNIMMDSGAATHVCPLWFADNYPIHRFDRSTASKPEDGHQQDHTMLWREIGLHAIKGTNQLSYHSMRVTYMNPILSVTRLAEQGFDIRFNDAPTMSHNKGFNVPLVQQHNLYYLPATIVNLEQHQQLQVRQTQEGMIAMIAPTTLTQAGPQQVLGGNNDYWNYNNEGVPS